MLQLIISTEDAKRLTSLFPCPNKSNLHETYFSSSNGTHLQHNAKVLERQFAWEDYNKPCVSLEIAFPKKDSYRPQVWHLKETDSKMSMQTTIETDVDNDRYVVRFSGHPKPFHFPVDQYNEQTLRFIERMFEVYA